MVIPAFATPTDGRATKAKYQPASISINPALISITKV